MEVDFSKSSDGLVPAIIQDFNTKNVLMLGYMNKEALEKTIAEKKVTFYSRSKQRLWTKGEESGNILYLKEIKADCDKDSLLIYTEPEGPVCHTGSDTCWNEQNISESNFLSLLENIIADRRKLALNNTYENKENKSYVASLFEKGINKIAQKVGEEAVEVIIEAKDNNDDLFLNESADLIFHYLILLQAKGFTLKDVLGVLMQRHRLKE